MSYGEQKCCRCGEHEGLDRWGPFGALICPSCRQWFVGKLPAFVSLLESRRCCDHVLSYFAVDGEFRICRTCGRCWLFTADPVAGAPWGGWEQQRQ